MVPTSLTDTLAGGATRKGFYAWCENLPIRVYVGLRHGQWYAVAINFRIVGVGSTPDEALGDLSGLLQAYLHSVYNQGRPLPHALRPIGLLTRLRLLAPLKRRRRVVLIAAH